MQFWHKLEIHTIYPNYKGRQTKIKSLLNESRTMIFYESPHRLIKALEQFIVFFGADRKASVSRELTKMFEETKRGTLQEILDYFKNKTIKGEIVIVLEGNKLALPNPPKGRENKFNNQELTQPTYCPLSFGEGIKGRG